MTVNRFTIPIINDVAQPKPAVFVQDQITKFNRVDPVRAPEGAPNVLLVMLDDVGFGAASTFGGPCRTPTADRLASEGLKYSKFHTTALCSPTRAATLTGRNHHSVGFGNIAEVSTTSPGYNGMRPASAATIARVLQGNGYATGAFGKMHQTPPWETTAAGPFDHWPLREGFDKFYGFLGAEADQFAPVLYDGYTMIAPPKSAEDGYHLSEDLVDQSIKWIDGVNSMDPDKPWFCYLPFGAVHAPLQIPDSYLEKYRGEFDHGWDEQREITLARQKDLGVVGVDTELAPWAPGVPHWDTLTDVQRTVSARLMETYAAFLEHTDDQVGRLVDHLEKRALLDNTLVIYMIGDNGASAEGGLDGSFNYMATLNGYPQTPEEISERLDDIGTENSYAHYPVGWALALDTPYQWAKQVASHYGGTRNGLVVHWPDGIDARGEIRHQWHHCVDITPTILEAAGIPSPTMVDGVPQQPVEGIAMNYSFDEADAADRHITQYFEVFGNRGLYDRGWTAVTAHRRPWELMLPSPDYVADSWELYDTSVDWSQARNLADEYPAKLREMQEKFILEAARYQVFPLDDRTRTRNIDPETRAPHVLRGRTGLTLYPHMNGLVESAAPRVFSSSYTITARIEVGDAMLNGVLMSFGGRFGGLALYVRDSIPMFCYNNSHISHTYLRGSQSLQPGVRDVTIDFDYDGGGMGMGGLFTLSVDGTPVSKERVSQTTPAMFSLNEHLDVGLSRGTPVTPEISRDGDVFEGVLDYVRIDVEATRPPREAELLDDIVRATQ
ncbi:Arylsulfatase [Rhodococcus erythropolis]|uniref:arylsulfatase n=1 Tax=Rhodococcus erythropolis TaxID=1833 RepID=UPI000BB2DF73|nr:arylsulfatase [Rhodococcus erythropolis]PBI88818.1 Arylsulfatase [Rhodococcus erythropolis]